MSDDELQTVVGRNIQQGNHDDDNDFAPISAPPPNNFMGPRGNNRSVQQVEDDIIMNNVNNNDDDDEAAVAQATAEVVATEGYQNAADRHGDETRVAEQALMGVDGDGIAAVEVTDESGELVQQRFVEFLNTFSENTYSNNDENGEVENVLFPYSDQANDIANKLLARRSVRNDNNHSNDEADTTTTSKAGFTNTMFVDFSHIMTADIELAEAIQTDFHRFEPYLRRGIQQFVFEMHPELRNLSSNETSMQQFFVAMFNLPTILPLRQLRTSMLCRLTSVTGTVTRTTEVRPELLVGAFRCNQCGLLAESIQQQYHFTRPTLCRNPRCQNTSALQFILETERSVFGDWQKLRVQENSDQIPPGCMPRSVDIMIRHEMVERAKAGDQCVFTGCLVVIPDGSALARAGEAPRAVVGHQNRDTTASGGGGGVSGLASLGVRELTYRTCFISSTVLPMDAVARTAAVRTTSSAIADVLYQHESESHLQEPTPEQVVLEFTNQQRREIREMKETSNLYQLMAESIAPNTFGHVEVKKGLLLMLLGGVHKTTADKIKLRGDINVCIVGDPSTAKSQFLKYVHSFLPSRCVYTSGKASSAAGLTAAVQRDHDTGEYCIEAGALMLADNGICCIDEFDKMDPGDQVAIHEAMEQQTISITKAGIQATLNARASVLAAANPVHGRYDRTKTLKANVALSAPILSRFDLFFVVLDECNIETDRQVAQHILKVHRCQDEAVQPPFTKDQMQRYIRFARTINPKITLESQQVLIDCYRKLRQGDTLGRSRTAYRITVRQLESMIRLSEAKARLHCDHEIRPSYVLEAFRLLKTSIIQVETSDVPIEDNDDDDDDDDDGDNNDAQDRLQTESSTDMLDQSESQNLNLETQEKYVQSEYSGAAGTSAEVDAPTESENQPETRKKKKTTKISFEEYEAMANAIATRLRSLEQDNDDDNYEPTVGSKWREVVDWYIEQSSQPEVMDSTDHVQEVRKKVNLVIRRLLNVDTILVTVGESPQTRRDEQETLLKVHPNYVIP